ncbi:MAG: fatty acid desaturase [Pseudomonadota bacterium]
MSSAERARQGLVGVGLAAAVTAAWLCLHIYGVHFFEVTWGPSLLLIPAMMMTLCWLSVGLFIISHDAIHGSLVPGRPGANRLIGWIVMTLYAGFDYDKLERNHHLHHEAPGTAADPDFSADHPRAFFPWFKEFILRHFGWRPLIFVNSVVAIYWLVLDAPMLNIVLFYGIPAQASAVQLFYFGTFRPHRHEEDTFADDHRTRSSRYGWLMSLLTCYHFGYHHEHHLYPHEPWWRLPARRRQPETQEVLA